MNSVLKISHLNYRKNQRQILRDVNLSIAPGKIVALLGENGAGKTTLMRIIAGVAKNYRGSVMVSGHKSELGRKSHISFTDALKGFGGNSRISAVVNFYEQIYPDFDLEEFRQLRQFMNIDLRMKLGQLSRGMREKLTIALTFARKADLYLLDEPFAGIDVMARKRIINSIILWKEDRASILISDHFVNEIASLLDEVAILKSGTIVSHIAAEDIRAQKQTVDQFYESFYGEDDE